MPDVVPKVSRATVRRARSLCLEMEGDSYSLESIADLAALVSLAEATLDAEEGGALWAAGVRNRMFLRIRRLLGKEERPGE